MLYSRFNQAARRAPAITELPCPSCAKPLAAERT